VDEFNLQIFATKMFKAFKPSQVLCSDNCKHYLLLAHPPACIVTLLPQKIPAYIQVHIHSNGYSSKSAWTSEGN